jgi:hypothetical protein
MSPFGTDMFASSVENLFCARDSNFEQSCRTLNRLASRDPNFFQPTVSATAGDAVVTATLRAHKVRKRFADEARTVNQPSYSVIQ